MTYEINGYLEATKIIHLLVFAKFKPGPISLVLK